MRIALIKTSSMGDVIHALPVVYDIVSARPDATIDWVVEEGFADLPPLHPCVRDVIPVAIRRWRRTLTSSSTWAQIREVRARLRGNRYDLALDLQGLFKSALVARWTGAPVAGFDRASAREPLASIAYAKRYAVPRDLHAIERLRLLAGRALGYQPEGLPRFGLQAADLTLPWAPRGAYAVLLHATSRTEKLWPVEHWAELGASLLARDVSLVLPWGSAAERDAAQRLADAIGGRGPAGTAAGADLIVAPRLSLRECARLLADAWAVVGVDTGLTHLAAALECRTVALFAATEAWRYGPYWTGRATSLGEAGRWPGPAEVLDALERLGETSR